MFTAVENGFALAKEVECAGQIGRSRNMLEKLIRDAMLRISSRPPRGGVD